jgi:hypothetical protein
MLVTIKPSFPNNAALAEGLRVKNSGGFLVAAGNTDDELGTLEQRVLATDSTATILPIDHPGVRHMIASGSINSLATVYAAAAGKIASSGTLIRGIALEAASGDGSVIRVLTGRASITGTVDRDNLNQDDLQPYSFPLSNVRTWDSMAVNIPATAGNDDLGLVTGTLGTHAPTLQSGDSKAATTNRYAGFQVPVPVEYVAGETITFVVNAGMLTTVSDDAALLDLEVYREAAPTVDICATAQQSINDLTAADKSFTITPTDVVPGDMLLCRVKIGIVDAATGTAVIGKINSIVSQFDIKG